MGPPVVFGEDWEGSDNHMAKLGRAPQHRRSLMFWLSHGVNVWT